MSKSTSSNPALKGTAVRQPVPGLVGNVCRLQALPTLSQTFTCNMPSQMTFRQCLLTGFLAVHIHANASSSLHLPPDTTFNAGAGSGDYLVIQVRVAAGEEGSFLLDTGSPFTVLDERLEPLLGKSRGSQTVIHGWSGERQSMRIYDAPKLYLGNVRLTTGRTIFTKDLRALFRGRSIQGVLGMDCIKNYCLQLNFNTRTIRFLDPDFLDTEHIGTPLPLTFSARSPAHTVISTGPGDLSRTRWMVDTASTSDGALKLGAIKGSASNPQNVYCFQNTVINGTTYEDLRFDTHPTENVLGLRFLARHLVTLDGPRKVLYLKCIRAKPLGGDNQQTVR